jgi:hypothetical protein
MLKWLVVFVLASVVFSTLTARLARFGLGRMPGDFRLRLGRHEVLVPLGSTALFMLLFWLLGHFL